MSSKDPKRPQMTTLNLKLSLNILQMINMKHKNILKAGSVHENIEINGE